ncbi:hypothetical protein ACFWDQ_21530 [Streptomyces sp. NPDC060053]
MGEPVRVGDRERPEPERKRQASEHHGVRRPEHHEVRRPEKQLV